jgi:hypothetical protein
LSAQFAEVAALFGARLLFMEKLNSLLNRPEYVHAALNHFPLIGLFVALALLTIGLCLRHRLMTLTGLVFVCALALSVWPVYAFGESGYDRVLSMADEPGEAFLKYHAALAHRWVFLYYLTAGVAALAFGLAWKWPRVAVAGAVAAVLLGIASLVAGMTIAQAGGEIRHREFRSGPAPKVLEQQGESR